MSERLKDKVAVVIGGTKGMGEAIVRRFCEAGAAVVFTGRSAELGQAIAADVRTSGGRIRFVQADLTNDEQLAEAVETAPREFGSLTTLVNVAGGTDALGSMGNTLSLTTKDWTDYLQAGLIGAMVTPVRCAVPHLIKGGGGSVVTIGSSVAERAVPGAAPYSATNAAERSLSRHWALEFAAQRVRFNVIEPGFVDTGTMAIQAFKSDPDVFKVFDEAHLLGLGLPDDIAWAALWLASDEARWVTGQNIGIDGGQTAFMLRGLADPDFQAAVGRAFAKLGAG